jgi:hypothetical protein
VEPPPEPPKAAELPPEPPKTAPPASDPAAEGLSALQWTGVAVGGLGLVSLIGSGITGAAASGEVAELDAVCPPVDGARLCPQSALNDAQFIAERGQNLATISTATTFAGLGLAATGTLLFLLGGDDEPAPATAASVRFAPVVGPGVAGLTLGGTFR